MAVPAGTFTGYAAVGEREDLSDIIHDISPTDFPFTSNVGRTAASAVFHEWQTDALASAAANSQIEGDDPSASTATATSRFGNYTNISWKVPRVTGTLRAVDTAGRRDEFDYQVAKRMKEIRRDIELMALGNQAATAGAAASARVCAGAGSWLWDNQVRTTTSSTTVTITSGAPTTDVVDVSSSAITESSLKTCIAATWDDGGDPNLILCGSTDKQTISGFSGIATQYKENKVSPAAIIGAADIYVSDFGTHYIVADRFCVAGTVYVIDTEYWKLAYLRPLTREPLSKTGDSERAMLVTEWTLEACNPAASGKVYSTA